MDSMMAGLDPAMFAVALVVAAVAGFVKGAVGFAMPMIMISALSSFMPPEQALAGLVLPTLVTNVSQALRQGWGEAVGTTRTYWRFLTAMVVGIALSAQMMAEVPVAVLFVALGLPITAYATSQLAGVPLVLRLEHRRGAEWGLGALGGLYGGFSGVWGPPMLVYLASTGVGKVEMVRALGVAFLLGAVVLLASHLETGVMDAGTLAFSAALCVPAQMGMVAGYRAQDRLDQARFRRWTMVVLVVMGLNLLRRGLM
ncbi:sulfite exporter TauE/SafE family protein [Rhodobacteraceae bacterium HSP-20]|uniref:Probable membrane transporter protein n=1 Tax=Paragemmobacter amnigenus TaxID=2852097 RepID=A0ABS6J2B2_9RHOB|nr:sulfite exporter TauE/SafE family protein [Rhodobacter amnigenus]MBU9697577.1 sulfite exporter TauE/SafE family protein [Rhodobacter amnigenus]MBV4388804.1 sulfite exporter TauE/SafE family protein [Rhodobacter amnigenus]